jgi:hypothetical protein
LASHLELSFQEYFKDSVFGLLKVEILMIIFIMSQIGGNFQKKLYQIGGHQCSAPRYSEITFTPLNINGLSLILNVLPLVVVTFLRMTSLVLT